MLRKSRKVLISRPDRILARHTSTLTKSTPILVRFADSRRERFVRPQPVVVKVGSFQ